MDRQDVNGNNVNGHGLLTVRQVSDLLGICERTAFELTRIGKLPAVRIGRAVRYDPVDVAAFIEACKDVGVDHA
jgi:excisionase family DNA binding protein